MCTTPCKNCGHPIKYYPYLDRWEHWRKGVATVLCTVHMGDGNGCECENPEPLLTDWKRLKNKYGVK